MPELKHIVDAGMNRDLLIHKRNVVNPSPIQTNLIYKQHPSKSNSLDIFDPTPTYTQHLGNMQGWRRRGKFGWYLYWSNFKQPPTKSKPGQKFIGGEFAPRVILRISTLVGHGPLTTSWQLHLQRKTEGNFGWARTPDNFDSLNRLEENRAASGKINYFSGNSWPHCKMLRFCDGRAKSNNRRTTPNFERDGQPFPFPLFIKLGQETVKIKNREIFVENYVDFPLI